VADTRVLLEGLTQYRTSLERHLSTLQGEFDAVQSRWHVFSAVYDGDAADEFKSHWAHTVARFSEYIARTTAIARMLDERIEYLREVNRREGLQ
jgi:uncharacterized protein YukE